MSRRGAGGCSLPRVYPLPASVFAGHRGGKKPRDDGGRRMTTSVIAAVGASGLTDEAVCPFVRQLAWREFGASGWMHNRVLPVHDV